jgi:protease PrsW
MSAVLAPDIPSPIVRRPVPRAWWRRWLPSWFLVLLTGMVLFGLVDQALVGTGDPLYLPGLILIGSLTVPAAFAVYVSQLKIVGPVPARVLALSALWGGVLGTVIAGVLETDTARTLGWLPTPLIGLIEESAKLVVPLGVLLVGRRLRRETTGLSVGVAVGVGFAVLETMGYALVTLVASQGSVAAMDAVLLQRALLTSVGHAAWTGLAAAALWRLRIQHTGRALLGFTATFVLVVTLHAIWDAAPGGLWYAGLAVLSLGLLLARLRLAARHDRAA